MGGREMKNKKFCPFLTMGLISFGKFYEHKDGVKIVYVDCREKDCKLWNDYNKMCGLVRSASGLI